MPISGFGYSAGLYVSGSVSVQSEGTVIANGGACTTFGYSYGVYNDGTGTVNVNTATGSDGNVYTDGYGVFNNVGYGECHYC